MKRPTKDLVEVLERLEDEATFHSDCGDPEFAENLRQQDTLIRKLAREAGYSLEDFTHPQHIKR